MHLQKDNDLGTVGYRAFIYPQKCYVPEQKLKIKIVHFIFQKIEYFYKVFVWKLLRVCE